jgi:capsular exopolysaccharide synthesis family protein
VEPFDYLRAIRRNWRVVAGAVLVALAVGFFTRSIEPGGQAIRTYEATTVLIGQSVARTAGDASSPQTAAALTTLPPIPERVAEDIGFPGEPSALAAQVTAEVDQESQLVNITASAGEAERATKIADAFAEQLLARLTELETNEVDEDISDLQAEIRGLQNRIDAIDDPESTEARGLQTQLDDLRSQLNGLKSRTIDPGFTILSDAEARPVTTAGFQAPRSFAVRMLIAGVLGLAAGIVLAVIVGRLDTRIRTKRMAEERFSAPVLAEVPVMRGADRKGIVAASRPTSLAAEEFRLLGAELSLAIAKTNGNGSSAGRSSTVLVTSPGPSEGKTTVVANLAASLSEMGKRVLVLSCDFHRPTVHALFGVENERGLADALTVAGDRPVLDGIVRETSIGLVDVVPSGSQPASAGELLSSDRMRAALAEARGMADVVLLDTPPILVSSDATHLLPQVDAVLLVARAARTDAILAERASELLDRLGAPVRGVVLNRASETPRPRGSRKYYMRTADAKRNGSGAVSDEGATDDGSDGQTEPSDRTPDDEAEPASQEGS